MVEGIDDEVDVADRESNVCEELVVAALCEEVGEFKCSETLEGKVFCSYEHNTVGQCSFTEFHFLLHYPLRTCNGGDGDKIEKKLSEKWR